VKILSNLLQILGGFLQTWKKAFRTAEEPTYRWWLRIRRTPEISELHYPVATL
ncbi:hypothetical protein X777_04503, partial [Ooceraea biroi]